MSAWRPGRSFEEEQEQIEEDYALERMVHEDHILVRAEKLVTDVFVARVAECFDPWDEVENRDTVNRVAAWLESKEIGVYRGVGWSDDPPANLEERIEYWTGDTPHVYLPQRVETDEEQRDAAWSIATAALHLEIEDTEALEEAVKRRHALEQLAMLGDDEDDE